MHLTFANTSPAAHLLASNPYSRPKSGTFLAQNSLHLRLKLTSLEPILASQKRHSCIFMLVLLARLGWFLGWVVWVTVFFGWEGVGELFATHAYFKLNLQEQKKISIQHHTSLLPASIPSKKVNAAVLTGDLISYCFWNKIV